METKNNKKEIQKRVTKKSQTKAWDLIL
jgi:hypothetical protein